MKKKKNNIKTIWLLEMIIILLIFAVIILVLNNNAKSIKPDEFIKAMEHEGLKIQNVKEQFKEEYVLDAIVAYNQYGTYQIEYVLFSDNESAKNAFIYNKEKFESQKDDTSKEFSSSNEKKSVYYITTKDRYMYVSRINNTIIFLNIDASYKSTCENIISKINY